MATRSLLGAPVGIARSPWFEAARHGRGFVAALPIVGHDEKTIVEGELGSFV